MAVRSEVPVKEHKGYAASFENWAGLYETTGAYAKLGPIAWRAWLFNPRRLARSTERMRQVSAIWQDYARQRVRTTKPWLVTWMALLFS